MDQQLEYAQMLEVPVSTVSVVKKKPFFKKKAKWEDDLKEQVVDSVNERMGDSVCPEDLTVPPRQETKSAFAATLADRSGRVLVAEIAAAGCNVVLDWGFWTRAERADISRFFQDQGVPYEWHYIAVSPEAWQRNIAARNAAVLAGETQDYYVDEGLLEKIQAAFEPDKVQ